MKNKNIRNVPTLRFPGFGGEWEQKKLGELCQIEKGKQINKNILLTNGKYYVLNGGINPSGYTDKFNTESNTISINEGGSCGFVKLNTERFWSGGHNYTLLKPKCEVKYLYNYLKWREKYINSLAVGTGIPNIQKKVLQGAVSVSYPLIQEQTKIGSFFSTIDALISETEKELEAYREQKLGMLQKMFPKNGADVPEIRFPGFTDAWEQRKFKNDFVCSQGLQVPIEEQLNEKKDGAEQFIRIVDVTQSKEPPRFVFNPTEKGRVSFDDLFFVRYGAVGTIGYGFSGVIANNLFKVTPTFEANNSFLYQLFSGTNFNKKLTSMSASTSMPAINFTALNQLEFMAPKIAEQKKIGEYFSHLDNLIALHQRELDKLIELKKGFMQKMFC